MSQLTRIAVFFDGGFFMHLNNYYFTSHPLRSDLSLEGLLDFIRIEAARLEGTQTHLCTLAEAHWFRGRFDTSQLEAHAKSQQKASGIAREERQLEDEMMMASITQHYFPLHINSEGKASEKGIDVWFSLEAYELCTTKNYDLAVLIAGDRDYVPLVKKLTAKGIRVLLPSWEMDFEIAGLKKWVKTSRHLQNESTYVLSMNKILDSMHSSVPHVKKVFNVNRA
jgi:uncharacterized LabA/DUF88 family protein